MIRIVHPKSGSRFFTHPGSRDQKSTRSRIRNTGTYADIKFLRAIIASARRTHSKRRTPYRRPAGLHQSPGRAAARPSATALGSVGVGNAPVATRPTLDRSASVCGRTAPIAAAEQGSGAAKIVFSLSKDSF
jgi:hypothetical protein